jgi:hypothetical protein
MKKMQDALKDVSNPTSLNYGKHLKLNSMCSLLQNQLKI